MKQSYCCTLLFAFLSVFVIQSNAQSCASAGDQSTFGTNDTWIGYVYQGTNFNSYKGYITRTGLSGTFDENFETMSGPFLNGGCSMSNDQYSIRFKMRKTFNGSTYIFTVGGNDGFRLSLNGGNTWVVNRWSDQAFNSTTHTIYLKGTYDLVLEYYNKGGDDRLAYSVSTSLLPLTLKQWSANLQAPGKVYLNWVADAVIDFDHFLVQRSVNATDWQNIQTIKNKNNSRNITYTYDYTDNSVPDGTVYYRLVMVDRDGTLRNAAIQTVANKIGLGFKVYPTVIENRLVTVRTEKLLTGGKIEISNMRGQIVQIEPWRSASLMQQVNLNYFVTAGSTYFIKVKDDNGFSAIQKIIVR